MKPATPDRWMTPSEAATYLGVPSAKSVYRLVKEHRLPFGRVGRKMRFSKVRLDAWVESCGGVVRRIA